ncbi:helix-turn-helix transcriptional regulator [Variovorax paradoxus]|nr:helix-turn-helix transcriptional regulator [Variovorax paradoxus]
MPRASSAQVRSMLVCLIGANVRGVRVAVGLTGGELAATSGISASMLSRLERGLVSPSIATVDHIARGLGVPVSRFFKDARRS